MKKIRVWDLPLRLFHWVLVFVVVSAIIAQKKGGDAMVWHFRLGYTALTLVMFRIVWGVVGPKYARFASFVKGPSAVMAYMKGLRDNGSRKILGHNPLGSLSVIALLAIVLVQAISGLFSNHEHGHLHYEGPLAKFVSPVWSDRISDFHADISGTLIYILIGLHLAAIAYYYFIKKEDLVKPMITGDAEIDSDAPAADDSWRMRLIALAILVVCAACVYYVVML